MVVRITQNVRDKIKVKAPTTEPVSAPPLFLAEWFVNLIIIDRRSYFLFSEATTLYSTVKSSNHINNQVAFSRLATDVLFEQFKHNGDLDIRIFENLAESVTLLKTNNRHITASMNQLALLAAIRGDEEDEGFDYLNGTILGILPDHYPRTAFRKAITASSPTRYQ